MDSLTRWGLALFVLLGAHTLDHAINQPAREVPALGGVVGLAGFAIVAVAIVLSVRRSPYAAEAAIGAGLATILGFAVVHLMGDWTPLSDPYWDFDANAISWLLLVAPIVAAVGLVLRGARELGGVPATR
jgi:hypothetical protein